MRTACASMDDAADAGGGSASFTGTVYLGAAITGRIRAILLPFRGGRQISALGQKYATTRDPAATFSSPKALGAHDRVGIVGAGRWGFRGRSRDCIDTSRRQVSACRPRPGARGR